MAIFTLCSEGAGSWTPGVSHPMITVECAAGHAREAAPCLRGAAAAPRRGSR